MKQFTRSILLLTVILAAVPLFAAPETFVPDKAHSEVTFRVKHFVTMVTGRFGEFDATINIDREKPAASTVEFTINPASIDTNNENRDKHLRSEDFFFVEKYPTLTFKSTSIKASKTKDVYDVTGELTMRGVTKTVTLPVTFLGFAKMGQREKAGFSIETTVNRKDYGINWNKALDQGGFMLSDDVKVEINIEADKKPAAPPAS
ncbi:MAG TPA: YceI family protein [Thermoanaerobaculia bacterium]|nr:YceI family protein [Thermoanaerobaculia bacterium]